jgi:hypothetical protein
MVRLAGRARNQRPPTMVLLEPTTAKKLMWAPSNPNAAVGVWTVRATTNGRSDPRRRFGLSSAPEAFVRQSAIVLGRRFVRSESISQGEKSSDAR